MDIVTHWDTHTNNFKFRNRYAVQLVQQMNCIAATKEENVVSKWNYLWAMFVKQIVSVAYNNTFNLQLNRFNEKCINLRQCLIIWTMKRKNYYNFIHNFNQTLLNNCLSCSWNHCDRKRKGERERISELWYAASIVWFVLRNSLNWWLCNNKLDRYNRIFV